MLLMGGCGGFDASVEVGAIDANGLIGVPNVFVDNVENGLTLLCAGVGLVVPNKTAPRSCFGFSSSFLTRSDFFPVFLSVLYLLTSLSALMLPGFLEHVFFLQQNMCSLRSSSGKYLGKSPLSCNSRDM